MTPEHGRRIGDLFETALGIDPTERDDWLGAACGDDAVLRADVARLLAQEDRAERAGLSSAGRASDLTESWPSPRPADVPVATEPGGASRGFTPKPAIVKGPSWSPVAEPPGVVRARLRELPVVYIVILVMATVWRHFVFGETGLALDYLDALVILALGGVIVLLSSRRPVSLAWLKALEFGMIALLAGRLAIVQYRLMLAFSLRDDRMMAQLTMKNIVLLTAILILTYGLYVPKSWLRAAVVVVPLAVLPFGVLLLLMLLYPEPMSWLWLGWRLNTTPRLYLFTFDALTLGILAIGAAFGSRAISLLRRQVAEARQLGQYRLGRRIGAGGMGEVYLAEHQLLKRPCALKLIRPGVVADAKALKRFEREVRLTATLSHPNTVEIYDYGRAEDGTYYYVMEYLPGLSLAELVERHGPLPAARAVYLLRQVCKALREAHGAGLIHRDIKPSNIFAARRGGVDDVAKLLDFGLVQPTARARSTQLSEEGRILGTPLFMSPEQARGGHELDERCDIYSLGAVAYYLLTGRPPFEEETVVGVLIALARDPVPPPSRFCPDIPEDVERVILRCLEKNPADRFPNAASLDRALGDCGCAAGWDEDHAARWWRGAGRVVARHAAVP